MGWKIVEGEISVPASQQQVPAAAAKQAEDDGVKAFVFQPKPGFSQGAPRIAVRCECGNEDRTSKTLERTRLPQRYLHCDFESFDTDLQYDHGGQKEVAGWNRSLAQAKLVVEGFARDFPVGVEHGLLLMGPCGIGKTHLAVAALRQIVLRGHTGLFYDYRELLKEIQASYNPVNQATEMSVLEPVLTTEVLLLDDLGASKPSLWALETVGHVLNTRYNEKRITLITTNFLDGDPVAAPNSSSGRPAAIEDSLTDRIGKRIRSRLYEMCRTIEMAAPDYRKEIRQASRFRA
jgi:DNA replication protein DnaC